MHSLRFLIADDSKALQAYMRQLLVEYGFDPACIYAANDTAAALELSTNQSPDFLLTDWFAQAELTGVALYEQILDLNPSCLYALMGRDLDATQIEQGTSAGALFCLSKPFTSAEIKAAMAQALEQLATLHPALQEHLAQRQSPSAVSHARHAEAPAAPVYKVGEQVMHQGRTETIKHVILRRGEVAVQLQGISGLIPAAKINKV